MSTENSNTQKMVKLVKLVKTTKDLFSKLYEERENDGIYDCVFKLASLMNKIDSDVLINIVKEIHDEDTEFARWFIQVIYSYIKTPMIFQRLEKCKCESCIENKNFNLYFDERSVYMSVPESHPWYNTDNVEVEIAEKTTAKLTYHEDHLPYFSGIQKVPLTEYINDDDILMDDNVYNYDVGFVGWNYNDFANVMDKINGVINGVKYTADDHQAVRDAAHKIMLNVTKVD